VDGTLPVWGFGLGALFAAAAWTATRGVFAADLFARENVRGRLVPVGVGVLLPVAAVGAEAVFAVAGALGAGSVGDTAPWRLLVLLAAVGFGLLGLVDDLAGTGDDRGFRGHLGALAGGRLTTGGLKLVGGAALALALAAAHPDEPFGWLIVDALLIALAANLANLLDRAPGRVGKVALAAFVLLILATGPDDLLVGVAVVAGAGAALLVPDLRERLMLGDAGSNVLGAVLGLGVVLTTGTATRVIVVIVLAGLNLVSEAVSFSRVIDRVAPLRALDRLGRPR
jgi:UDP-N-acetylmuramyl pentapeptide phosphotransferase/UDP-N-acetylglucosamine-1-phosphate transferase